MAHNVSISAGSKKSTVFDEQNAVFAIYVRKQQVMHDNFDIL
jgi:hypothetical protein